MKCIQVTQFFFYLIVGGLSFLVELATFIALPRAAMPVIPASVSSFVGATIADYLPSIVLAFQRGHHRIHVELTRFGVYRLAIPPTLTKIGVVPIVPIWNYLGSRKLVFEPASRSRSGPGSHQRVAPSFGALLANRVQASFVRASRQRRSTHDRRGRGRYGRRLADHRAANPPLRFLKRSISFWCGR
jgi:putative flippase GtrA